MEQHHPELVLERRVIGSSAIQHFAQTRSDPITLPENNAIPAEPVFSPSHSHRVWRMMNALIDAVPEWTDAATFEQAREKMLRHGLSRGMTLEELYALSDPDAILGLWTAAEAKDVEV
jgi:hypothetical protein